MTLKEYVDSLPEKVRNGRFVVEEMANMEKLDLEPKEYSWLSTFKELGMARLLVHIQNYTWCDTFDSQRALGDKEKDAAKQADLNMARVTDEFRSLFLDGF